MRQKRTFFKSDIVENYIKKFPNTASNTLAKKIFVENLDHFKDVEDARSSVRYVRGLNGNKNRKARGGNKKDLYVKPFTFANTFNIPKSDAEKPKIFYLPKDNDNILFISDLHIPYHDVKALTVALQYGKDQDVNTIFINGDLLDFYQISRFVNVVRKRSVKEELEIAKAFLASLRQAFPNVALYFLKGNHDNRLETYLATKAPELLDVEEFRLEFLLEAEKYNMKVIEDTTLVKIAKLNVTHGHLLTRGFIAPVNAARGAFLRSKASVIISHVHKISSHSETTISNKVITCYSTGCLCELNPRYNPFGNNYSHGFAHITTEPNGHYKVKNFQIIDGELIN